MPELIVPADRVANIMVMFTKGEPRTDGFLHLANDIFNVVASHRAEEYANRYYEAYNGDYSQQGLDGAPANIISSTNQMFRLRSMWLELVKPEVRQVLIQDQLHRMRLMLANVYPWAVWSALTLGRSVNMTILKAAHQDMIQFINNHIPMPRGIND